MRRSLRAALSCPLAAFLYSAASVGEECRDPEQPNPAYSAEGGLRIAVVRVGILKQNNPLRPLSTQPLSIWQVAVNGKPGYLREVEPGLLQELSSVGELEYMNSAPVAWGSAPKQVPTEMTVLTTQSATIGPFRFAGCEARTRVPPPSSAENSVGRKAPNSTLAVPSPVRLPKGAISN
jgi:hypothetical protein